MLTKDEKTLWKEDLDAFIALYRIKLKEYNAKQDEYANSSKPVIKKVIVKTMTKPLAKAPVKANANAKANAKTNITNVLHV